MRATLTRPRSLILAALLFTGLALGAAAASAASPDQAQSERQAKREARMMERVNDALDDIDATDAQRAVVFAQLAKLKPQADAVRALRQAQRPAMRQAMLSPKPDAERVRALIEESSTASMSLAHKAADSALVIHAALTPKQRDELAQQWDMPKPDIKGSWWIDRGLARALKRVDATEAQIKQANASKDALVKEAAQLVDALWPLRQTLMQQWRADKPNAKLVHATLDRAGVLVTQLVYDASDEALRLTATFSDAQRQKAHAQLDKMKARHGER